MEDAALVVGALNEILPITRIACGDCPTGADLLVKLYAETVGIEFEQYKAYWDKEGRLAGPKRNYRMLESERPDLLVAFPGGAGTHNAMQTAYRLKIPIWRVHHDRKFQDQD